MSKLEYFSRPLVAFDPYNKDHRRYFTNFLKHGGWGTCPVRFICPDEVSLSLPEIIRQQLIAYYVEKEFKVKPREGSFIQANGKDLIRNVQAMQIKYQTTKETAHAY